MGERVKDMLILVNASEVCEGSAKINYILNQVNRLFMTISLTVLQSVFRISLLRRIKASLYLNYVNSMFAYC